jgi:Co/Zn/Cd efflux system component
MDSVMGLVGAVVIRRWSYVLLIDTSRILQDKEATPGLVEKNFSTIEADADNLVADLHVWQVSPQNLSVILTVVTHFPQPPDHYKALRGILLERPMSLSRSKSVRVNHVSLNNRYFRYLNICT